ncbi:MAG TPA: DNA polymerase [Mycobacteriales bacterium]|nr:DNA polymerase [Mycobacteriales bacterium]
MAAGLRPAACWDLGAVHRLLHGGRRDDPAAVWSPASGVPEPRPPSADLTLLDLAADQDPVRADGRLSPDWAAEPWAARADPGDLVRAQRWAGLALHVQQRQAEQLAALPDPRTAPAGPPLALLTAYAESAAALLAVELEQGGLPVDRATAQAQLTAAIGPRPADPDAARRERDAPVLQHFAGAPDLRNPVQVRELLAGLGIDVPDTRSWRLEPHRATSPAVAALLDWRRAERIATTYGWSWLDRHVGEDGRLRGSWGAADAAAGRMTASAGLHNLPADLRPAVAAEPGHLLVRADLGQVEPRVLAVVSGDAGLAAAAREQDMYAPVAAALGCDRPTAKVAVLAAMYGATSGTAGAALQRMDRAYPQALAHLRAAEAVGCHGGELRTWGGRLLRFPAPTGEPTGAGRYARNAVVQGAAAELFKMWAVTVRAGLGPLHGSIVLCLHDELLLHVPAAAAPAAADLLGQALEETAGRWAAGSGVRFVADIAVVRRWSDAKG